MNYTIFYKKALTHFIHVQIEINVPKGERIMALQQPSWRPGRYELANFVKNTRSVKAENGAGRKLPLTKTGNDSWQMRVEGEEVVRVSYEYYAHKMDAGSSWLDDKQLYLNFVNCLMYVPELEPQPHRVKIKVPESYREVCALRKDEDGAYMAEDFQELADSPYIGSEMLKEWTYTVGETEYHLWFMGEHLPDKEKTLEIFQDFTIAQTKVMGALPISDYHFMFQLLPYKHFHGVEHRASTVISLGPDTKIDHEKLYKYFIGVSSHELFHAWNVCRLRPAEMLPYNFSREVYFETGYVAEGVTTYYGDLFLARSGFFKASDYLDELNTSLKVFGMHYAGRHTSLADSSLNLWVNGYEPGIPDSKMSIYNEGTLAALVLDLLIRKLTEDRKSLDTVMVSLYERFAEQGKGYTAEDYRKIAEEVAGQDLSEYFETFIYGPLAVWEYLPDLLDRIGLQLEWVSEEDMTYSQRFGFRLGKKDDEGLIAHLAPGSEAEGVLSLKDELVAVNGRRFDKEDELNFYRGTLRLAVFRDDVLQEVEIKEGNEPYYAYAQIVPKENPGEEELSSMKKWLRG